MTTADHVQSRLSRVAAESGFRNVWRVAGTVDEVGHRRPHWHRPLDPLAGRAEMVITYAWRATSKPLLRRPTWLLRPDFAVDR